MKTFDGRMALTLKLGIALALSIISGPLGLLALFSLSATPLLGVSYNKVNTTTKTNLTDQTSKVEEELWARRIVLGSDHCYQENPFSDGFSSLDGNKPDSGKAIVKITDTEKVHGTIVNIPTRGGFGGPGVAGEGDRIGSEMKIQRGNFQVKIGRFWFGVGYTAVGRDETVIGGDLDQEISDGLRFLHAKKRSDDIQMKLIQAAASAAGFRNRAFATGITSRANLRSANVVDTTLVTATKNILSGLGALPVALGPMDSGGSRPERFIFMGTHFAMADLETEPAYLAALQYADTRGTNAIFAGNLKDWNGTGLYRWYMRDHGNWGPVGSPLCPRAFLSTALTGADTASIVTGGGTALAAATTPTPHYFEFFSNAPYTFHDNTTIAADVATARYIMIINSDGTGFNVYSYHVNDGTQITILARVSVSGEGNHNHPLGSLIVECNAVGVPFGRSLTFGREMICAGQGSINGSKVSPQMGRRTDEIRNHGMDFGIGAEAVWGCSVVTRSDGVYPNFVLSEHALTVAGAPIIT